MSHAVRTSMPLCSASFVRTVIRKLPEDLGLFYFRVFFDPEAPIAVSAAFEGTLLVETRASAEQFWCWYLRNDASLWNIANEPIIMLSVKRDRANDYFRTAMSRLIKRCHQASRRYDADVYILIRRRCRHYEYKSTEDPSFPPTNQYLVSLRAIVSPMTLTIAGLGTSGDDA